jgi:hypothetical protein
MTYTVSWVGRAKVSEAFDAKTVNVSELLGSNQSRRLVVPRFQRGYSWDKKHIEALWKDIMRFMDEGGLAGHRKYFLGPIVTLNEVDKETHLLDGQQRLATTTILCSVIRNEARRVADTPDAKARNVSIALTNLARDIQVQSIQKDDDGPYSLALGENDEVFFKETVQSDPAQSIEPTLRSHRKIQAAQRVLVDLVQKKTATLHAKQTLHMLKDLWNTIRQSLVMTCIPVMSERDAFQIFETLNDRGLRLSPPDLLLNYLMRVANPESDRPQIRALWTAMLEQMGRRDTNRFLRHLWVSKYGDIKEDLFTALKTHIEASSIGSVDFVRECHAECGRYVELLDGKETLGDAKKHVEFLVRVLDIQQPYRYF